MVLADRLRTIGFYDIPAPNVKEESAHGRGGKLAAYFVIPTGFREGADILLRGFLRDIACRAQDEVLVGVHSLQ